MKIKYWKNGFALGLGGEAWNCSDDKRIHISYKIYLGKWFIFGDIKTYKKA